MDEELQRRVLITESGQQVPVQMAANATGGIMIPGDPIKEDILLDVTDREFATMQDQALKNKIPRAMLVKKRKGDS